MFDCFYTFGVIRLIWRSLSVVRDFIASSIVILRGLIWNEGVILIICFCRLVTFREIKLFVPGRIVCFRDFGLCSIFC
jgi:hypothetical protein